MSLERRLRDFKARILSRSSTYPLDLPTIKLERERAKKMVKSTDFKELQIVGWQGKVENM